MGIHGWPSVSQIAWTVPGWSWAGHANAGGLDAWISAYSNGPPGL